MSSEMVHLSISISDNPHYFLESTLLVQKQATKGFMQWRPPSFIAHSNCMQRCRWISACVICVICVISTKMCGDGGHSDSWHERTKIVPLSVQFRGDPASRILRCMITRCAWGWIRNCRHYLTSFCDLQFVQMDDGLDGDFVDYFPFSVTSRLIILVRGMLNVCVELKQESCRL